MGQDPLQIEDRRRRVAKLALRGMGVGEIARELGVHRNTISRDLAALRRLWQEAAAATAAEHLAELLARLDQVEQAAWAQVEQFGPKALQVVVAALRQRAEVLGLNKVQVNLAASVRRVEEMSDEELLAICQRSGSGTAASPQQQEEAFELRLLHEEGLSDQLAPPAAGREAGSASGRSDPPPGGGDAA